jgi:hypothetical protein
MSSFPVVLHPDEVEEQPSLRTGDTFHQIHAGNGGTVTLDPDEVEDAPVAGLGMVTLDPDELEDGTPTRAAADAEFQRIMRGPIDRNAPILGAGLPPLNPLGTPPAVKPSVDEQEANRLIPNAPNPSRIVTQSAVPQPKTLGDQLLNDRLPMTTDVVPGMQEPVRLQQPDTARQVADQTPMVQPTSALDQAQATAPHYAQQFTTDPNTGVVLGSDGEPIGKPIEDFPASMKAATLQLRDGLMQLAPALVGISDLPGASPQGAVSAFASKDGQEGLTKVLNSAMQLSTPLLAIELTRNPAVAQALMTGIFAGQITGAGARKITAAMGGSQSAQDLAESAGGLAGGLAAGIGTNLLRGNPGARPEVLPPTTEGIGAYTPKTPPLLSDMTVEQGDTRPQLALPAPSVEGADATAKPIELDPEEVQDVHTHPAGKVTAIDQHTGLPIVDRTQPSEASKDAVETQLGEMQAKKKELRAESASLLQRGEDDSAVAKQMADLEDKMFPLESELDRRAVRQGQAQLAGVPDGQLTQGEFNIRHPDLVGDRIGENGQHADAVLEAIKSGELDPNSERAQEIFQTNNDNRLRKFDNRYRSSEALTAQGDTLPPQTAEAGKMSPEAEAASAQAAGAKPEVLAPVKPATPSTGTPGEAAYLKTASENGPALVKQYIADNSKGGVLNIAADAARELFPGYVADRTGQNADVEGAANMIADAAFRTALSVPPEPGKEAVRISVASPGSGKTTGLGTPGADQVGLNVETIGANYASLRSRVQAILDSGRQPQIQWTFVDDPAKTVERMIYRAAGHDGVPGIGRPVPVSYMIQAYDTLPDNLERLERDFGDKVNIGVVDNSGPKGSAEWYPETENKLDHFISAARQWQGRTKEVMDAELEKLRAARKIPNNIYRAATAVESRATDRGTAQGQSGSGVESGGNRGVSPAGGRERAENGGRHEQSAQGLPGSVLEAPETGAQPVGTTEPETGRIVTQSTDKLPQAQELATAAAPELKAKLASITKGIPGADVAGVRPAKNPARAREKAAKEGQPVETISDLLAARVSAASPAAHDRVVAAIKQQFPVIKDENQFTQGEPDYGYRSTRCR